MKKIDKIISLLKTISRQRKIILYDGFPRHNKKFKAGLVFIVESKQKRESVPKKLRKMEHYGRVFELPDIYNKDRIISPTAMEFLEKIDIDIELSLSTTDTQTLSLNEKKDFTYCAVLDIKTVALNGMTQTSTTKIHPGSLEKIVDTNIIVWCSIFRSLGFNNVEIRSTDNNLLMSSDTFRIHDV